MHEYLMCDYHTDCNVVQASKMVTNSQEVTLCVSTKTNYCSEAASTKFQGERTFNILNIHVSDSVCGGLLSLWRQRSVWGPVTKETASIFQ
jgi:hypothetical protein